MWDEDGPKPLPRRVAPVALEPLGIAELHDYIVELRAEITRAETAIARKDGHRGEAERFFRGGKEGSVA